MPSFDANAAIEAAKKRARDANKPSARLYDVIDELENIYIDTETPAQAIRDHIHGLTNFANVLEDNGE